MGKSEEFVKSCPICGGSLCFEAVGSYGDCFKIDKRTGRLCKKKFRRVHYAHGDFMVYCLSCSHNFEFKRTGDGHFKILGY